MFINLEKCKSAWWRMALFFCACGSKQKHQIGRFPLKDTLWSTPSHLHWILAISPFSFSHEIKRPQKSQGQSNGQVGPKTFFYLKEAHMPAQPGPHYEDTSFCLHLSYLIVLQVAWQALNSLPSWFVISRAMQNCRDRDNIKCVHESIY